MTTYSYFVTSDGQTILILTILIFLLLLTVILTAAVCLCLWRNFPGCRTWYFGPRVGDEETLFYDRSGKANWTGGELPLKSTGTQTDLTAAVIMDKGYPLKYNSGPVVVKPAPPSPPPPSSGKPVVSETQTRWSKINPKLYLNPWTYRTPRKPDNSPVVSPSSGNIYTDQW